MGLFYLSNIHWEVKFGAIDMKRDRWLIHNNARPNSKGFRAWYAKPSDNFVPCPCGWNSEGGTHYRIRRDSDRPVSHVQTALARLAEFGFKRRP